MLPRRCSNLEIWRGYPVRIRRPVVLQKKYRAMTVFANCLRLRVLSSKLQGRANQGHHLHLKST